MLNYISLISPGILWENQNNGWKSGILGIKMETCRCIGITQRTPNFTLLLPFWKLAMPFLLDTIVYCFLASFFLFFLNLRLWLTKLPYQELTLSIKSSQKDPKSEDFKYDTGSDFSCNEFRSCHSIIRSKKMEHWKFKTSS